MSTSSRFVYVENAIFGGLEEKGRMITTHRLAISIAIWGVLTAGATAQEFLTFEHDGLTRDYIYYAPEGIESGAALVFVLHGYTGTAENAMDSYDMNDVADDEGFAVCYPQGARDLLNINHWNANLSLSDIDDVGFLTELAGFLQSERDLSVSNTFICGMSNGGFMSYTLACEKPDVFSAIASVTGTMSGFDWENCDPDNAVPVLQISGADDVVVPIDGSMSTLGGWGGAPGMDSVTAFWVERNECTTLETRTISAVNETAVKEYTDGIFGHEVHQYLIADWGHNWPTSTVVTGFEASEVIWEFFAQFIDETTSVDRIARGTQISVFPNPVSTDLTVRRSISERGAYQIISSSGANITGGQVVGQNPQIDVSMLPPGLYVLMVDGEVVRFTK